jgi:hypothetical protein
VGGVDSFVWFQWGGSGFLRKKCDVQHGVILTLHVVSNGCGSHRGRGSDVRTLLD